MPKRPMSFKPTPECEVQLAELMDRFKFDRTSVVIMAVDIAHRQLFPEKITEVMPRVSEEQAKEHRTKKLVEPIAQAPKSHKAVQPLTREEREAKIAAAQGWLGKKK